MRLPFKYCRPRFTLRGLLVFVSLLSIFAASWSATSTWGTADITAFVLEREEAGFLKSSTRLEHDPDTTRTTVPMPFHYVGCASSPCPLIVGVDIVFFLEPSVAQREREYYLWFYGAKHRLSFIQGSGWTT